MAALQTALFALLQPGMALTLPPVGKKVFASCQTSPMSVVVHAAVFAAVLYALKVSVEAFQNASASSTTTVVGEPPKAGEGFGVQTPGFEKGPLGVNFILMICAWGIAVILLPLGFVFQNMYKDITGNINMITLFSIFIVLILGLVGLFL